MVDIPFQTQFRQQIIRGYEKTESCLTKTTTTEHTVNGNEAVFLVADSGGATAVTRDLDGDIPYRNDNNNQTKVILEEWHDGVQKTNFNVMSAQGNQIQLMQQTIYSVINRKRDEFIRNALDEATISWAGSNATPASATASLAGITKAWTILRNNYAGDGDIFAAITPAFHGYLMAMKEFVNHDYIQDKKFEGVPKHKAFSWWGINWIVDPDIEGVGTGVAKCYMYNRSAIGSAMHKEGMDAEVGYEAKHKRSWANLSVHMNAKLIQNNGVIRMHHDDTAYSQVA